MPIDDFGTLPARTQKGPQGTPAVLQPTESRAILANSFSVFTRRVRTSDFITFNQKHWRPAARIFNSCFTICNRFQFNCCGAYNFLDWRQSAWYESANSDERRDRRPDRALLRVPSFCCRNPAADFCAKRDHPSNIYYDVSVGVF